ncbi:MAG: hypothetical protein HYT37_00485 [Candidatus Sungbacteria bacterium]|nr:hypothetical protein [Candidatus Sungbacteria bacterium]
MKREVSEEGKKALAEWAKIRDYITPSVTLLFNEKTVEHAIEIALTEKIQFSFGRFGTYSLEVPAAVVCVFSHLSPRIAGKDENDTERVESMGRERRKLVTAEESIEKMKGLTQKRLKG